MATVAVIAVIVGLFFAALAASAVAALIAAKLFEWITSPRYKNRRDKPRSAWWHPK